MKWENLEWSKGPGRVIDRRGQAKPKLDPKKAGTYTGQQLANSRGGQQGTAHKLGLSAFGAPSIRSMGPRLGQTMPKSYKVPDRKSTRSMINNFTKGR